MFDNKRLQQTGYDLARLPDRAKLRKTVVDFMQLLRRDAFDDNAESAISLVTTFCQFVDNDDAWYLIETQVPEFRVALVDQ